MAAFTARTSWMLWLNHLTQWRCGRFRTLLLGHCWLNSTAKGKHALDFTEPPMPCFNLWRKTEGLKLNGMGLLFSIANNKCADTARNFKPVLFVCKIGGMSMTMAASSKTTWKESTYPRQQVNLKEFVLEECSLMVMYIFGVSSFGSANLICGHCWRRTFT